MYNLFIHEKQLSDAENKKIEDENNLKIEKKRKRRINNLSSKYNTRMKKFIFELCDDPIYLHKNEVIKDNIKFKFNLYITEKQKLEALAKEKNELKIKEEQNEEYRKNAFLANARRNNKNILVQPMMRFTDRKKNIKRKDEKKKDSSRVKYIKGYEILKDIYGEDYKYIKDVLSADEDNEDEEFDNKKYILSKLSDNNLEIKHNEKDYLIPINALIINKDSLNRQNSAILSINKKQKRNRNRKLYFKGASQYVSLQEGDTHKTEELKDEDISIIYTSKNIYYKKKDLPTKKVNINLSKTKLMQDIIKLGRNNSNLKSKLNQMNYKKESNFKKYSTIDNNKSRNFFVPEDYLISEYDNVKGLSKDYQLKKIKMNSLISKEIQKSILKRFTKKYNIISNLGYNDKNEKNNNELDNDLKYLKNLVISRNKDVVEKIKLEIPKLKKFPNSVEDLRKEKKKVNCVLIDGQFIPKNELKTISDTIFTKCNFYNRKYFDCSNNTKFNNKLTIDYYYCKGFK